MITPMKKVTILCLETEREAAVEALRSLGLVHVVRTEASAAGDASSAAADQERVRRAHRILDEVGKAAKKRKSSVFGVACGDDLAPDALVERVLSLDAAREDAAKRLRSLRAEEESQAPFGEFDPEQLRTLAEQGARVSLFRLPRKAAARPQGEAFLRSATILRETPTHLCGCVLGDLPAPESPDAPEGLEPVAAPARPLSAVRSDIAAAEAARTEADASLSALAPQADALDALDDSLGERREFLLVRDSIEGHGVAASLDGFLPAGRVSELRAAARLAGWALWIREPDPDEKVPVSLTLPRWLRPVSVLFQGLGILPGYREVDASAVFLAFFSVFFAMIVGDAGYGALLLAAVLLLRLKFRKADARPFWLFGLFGVCTLVWGALTGSWFAIGAEHLPATMRGISWLKPDNNVMWLCFLIGAAHLTIANLWNAAVLWPDTKALAQVGWAMMNVTMLFVAGQLVTGRPFPMAAAVVGIVGLVLIVLFMLHRDEIKREFINYPMLVLNLVSALVDVMSYIRLFAVGMASAKIAMNFNQMAMSFDLPAWIRPLPVLLILLFGHGLNIVLGALSILVHAVRLNTLEFSNHVGLTWSGEPYRPYGGR